MNKVIEFIKNKKIIILTIVSVSFLIFIVFKINKSNRDSLTTNTSTPSSINKIASFNEIVPGKTSLEKINELLGKPIESTRSGSLDISDYKSTNQYRNHKVYSKDGLVELIIEEVINKSKTSEDIQKIYSVAPISLFQKFPSSTFKLYVYPNNGIAYLGHQDGTILEIWYFEPTTIDDFILKWGSDYLKDPPKEIPIY